MNKDIDQAIKALNNGGVISFPTDTVMGLGVVFDNYNAYTKLNKIKGRPENKPYSLMVSSVDEIDKYAYVNKNAKKVINAFLPGPLTVILPVRECVPEYVTHGLGTIGIRVVQNDIVENIIKGVQKPLLVPSANPSGLPPALNSEQVSIYFGETLDYIVVGKAGGTSATTIVDLTSEDVKILREGPVSLEDIEKVLSEEKL